MENNRILEKIKKLLALSENNPSSKETFAAMLKAQQLLMANGLSMEDANIEENQKEVVEEEISQGTVKIPFWRSVIILAICKNFKVTPFKSSNGKKTKIRLVGLKEDVMVCKEVLEYSFSAFQSLSKAYLKQWKENNPDVPVSSSTSKAVKNDYLMGFCEGLGEKFEQQVKEMALIVIQDKLVVDYVQKMNFSKGRSRTVSGRGDKNAYAQGYSDAVTLSKHKVIA